MNPVDWTIEADTRIKDIPFSCRARNCLLNLGCKTIGDAALLSDHELRCTPNIGRVTLDEIKDRLGRITPDYRREKDCINEIIRAIECNSRVFLAIKNYVQMTEEQTK